MQVTPLLSFDVTLQDVRPPSKQRNTEVRKLFLQSISRLQSIGSIHYFSSLRDLSYRKQDRVNIYIHIYMCVFFVSHFFVLSFTHTHSCMHTHDILNSFECCLQVTYIIRTICSSITNFLELWHSMIWLQIIKHPVRRIRMHDTSKRFSGILQGHNVRPWKSNGSVSINFKTSFDWWILSNF